MDPCMSHGISLEVCTRFTRCHGLYCLSTELFHTVGHPWRKCTNKSHVSAKPIIYDNTMHNEMGACIMVYIGSHSLVSWRNIRGNSSNVWTILLALMQRLFLHQIQVLVSAQFIDCDKKKLTPAVLNLFSAIWKYISISYNFLSHWGRMTHICVSKLAIIGSDNGLSPGRHQAIIWTNARILLIGPLGTNFSAILIEIYTFLFKKMHLKMSSRKCRPFLSWSQCVNTNIAQAAGAMASTAIVFIQLFRVFLSQCQKH